MVIHLLSNIWTNTNFAHMSSTDHGNELRALRRFLFNREVIQNIRCELSISMDIVVGGQMVD